GHSSSAQWTTDAGSADVPIRNEREARIPASSNDGVEDHVYYSSQPAKRGTDAGTAAVPVRNEREARIPASSNDGVEDHVYHSSQPAKRATDAGSADVPVRNEREARIPASSDDRVEVFCEFDNQQVSFNASRAIITLPLGVLQHGAVRFVPDLPPEKQAAINDLAMGNVLRIVLRFRERFWEELKFWDEDTRVMKFADAAFIHYPDAPIPTWWTQLPIRAPILVGWAGGPRAESSRRSAADSKQTSSAQRTTEHRRVPTSRD